MAAAKPGNIPDTGETRRPWAWWLGGAAVLVLALCWIGLGGLRTTPAPPSPPVPPVSPAPQTFPLGKGRTIQDTLCAHVPKEAAYQIVQAFRPHLDFRRLKAEDTIALHRDPGGAVVRVVYTQSPIDIFEVGRTDGGWQGARREVPVERRAVVVGGKLVSSLFESVEELGERPQLVMDFAEIFAWDFDFAQDSQPGDTFRMLVEKVYTGDRFVKYGRILAAEYVELGGKVHAGVFFTDKEGGGYYTAAGESLRRSFLRSPLEFTRISSKFSRGRRHPILGGVRPHLAVDYAAPSGTPVWAVADGTVEQIGWGNGNGNMVVLRHRAGFRTMYNHLSGFGKGLRAGSGVRQRQVIGYVGSTGLSTGPHLDYRVMKDGKFVNPLKQTYLPGQPIAPASRTTFAQARDALLQQLRGGATVAQAGQPDRK
jgi:murein DD-endopeptidase MepM/ murein hydrolase activator NlpD